MITQKYNEPCDAYYEIFTDKPTKDYKYQYLSPFEFQDVLINTAKKSICEENILNAGRGNPSFYSVMPRYAFSHLTRICTKLGDELGNDNTLGYIPEKKNISKKFKELLKKVKGKEGKFLREACDKMRRISNMDNDSFVHNLVISTIGCLYPNPPRVQNFVEPVLTEFMDKNIYRSKKSLHGKVTIMPTEGCAAAIIYAFNSLKYNGLVIPGDQIGILTPIFSPYLEIPTLRNYDLKQICIKADPDNNWEISAKEISKLGDTKMKALFLVNPTNPTALSLSAMSVRKMASVIRKKNPDLIILEDNVYAPYAREFNSFFNILPRNTIGVFSLSKYFGVTGWRLGSIIMNNSNIIDGRLLKNAPDSVHNRYSMLKSNPSKIKFMDRILADSRQVAEAHVAGLSTPQQVIMSLFAVCDLLDKERDYQNNLDDILLERTNNLLDPLNYEINQTDLNTNYYITLDITKVSDSLMGGSAFGEYLRNNRDPFEFVIKLAKKYGTILLPGVSFAGPFWAVRVSLANLGTEDYSIIGENLRSLIDEYYEDFKKWETKKRRESEKE